MATNSLERTPAFTGPTRRISGSFSPATWHSSSTMARTVGRPATGAVVITVEASPVSQYDLMISGNYGYRRHLSANMATEGVGRVIAVGNAPNDAVEQALSKTSLAELVRGVG